MGAGITSSGFMDLSHKASHMFFVLDNLLADEKNFICTNDDLVVLISLNYFSETVSKALYLNFHAHNTSCLAAGQFWPTPSD